MKMLSAGLIMIACTLVVAPVVQTQTMVIAEGYSAITVIPDAAAQSTLESLRQKNPTATLAEARLAVAQRGARMEALRNAAEFLYGIGFEYSGGKITRTMTLRSEGTVQPGGCTYRTLRSGLVVASLEVSLPALSRENREGLPSYEVTGICEDEGVESVVMAMRQARTDAIARAVRRAVEDHNPTEPESNRVFRGKVYIVRTVEDEPGIPYQVTMVVLVRLDR